MPAGVVPAGGNHFGVKFVSIDRAIHRTEGVPVYLRDSLLYFALTAMAFAGSAEEVPLFTDNQSNFIRKFNPVTDEASFVYLSRARAITT